MIHIDGYYNINEMAELCGKSIDNMRGRLYFFYNQFKTIRIGNKLFAEKETFDEWISRGAPDRMRGKIKTYNDIGNKKRSCKHYFIGCGNKIHSDIGYKRNHMICIENCPLYENRNITMYPIKTIHIDGKTNIQKVHNFIKTLSNEVRTKDVSEGSE